MNKKKRLGLYLSRSLDGKIYKAYVPKPLPPIPKLEVEQFADLLESANRSVGRLDGITSLLPNLDLFIRLFVRKEALLSSKIEGTKSTFSDLIMFEQSIGVTEPVKDVRWVANYVLALNYGVERVKNGFPFSSRLIRQMHEILMKGVDGQNQFAGFFRKEQNWIGGTSPMNAIFVPPPAEMIPGLIADLEKFAHKKSDSFGSLITAALLHTQFETIHPFLDGNGRIGRLIITVILCSDNFIKNPSLFLSFYFKKNRRQYCDLLNLTHETGDFESWIEFFLNGVIETSKTVEDTIKKILNLFEKDSKKLESLGRTLESAKKIYAFFQNIPVASISKISEETKLSFPVVSNILNTLIKLGIVTEITGKERDRLFVYKEYSDILEFGI